MRTSFVPLLALLACDGAPTEEPPPQVDCTTEGRNPLAQVAVPDWPAGLSEAIDTYRGLDGRYSAEACGEAFTFTIQTDQVVDSNVLVVTDPLPAGNTCGCTHDPDYPSDGDLQPIARANLNLAVQGYPEAAFREEGAGNVGEMPVALFSGAQGVELRACALQLVPPVLQLDHRDVEVTIRVVDGVVSGHANLIGGDVPESGCDFENVQRLAD